MEKSELISLARPRFTWTRFLTALSRLVVLFIMVLLVSILNPKFLTTGNLLNVLRQAAPIFIIGVGQTIVILARGIDLSMDSVASLTSVVTATLMIDNHVPFYLAMGIGLALGAVLGLFNGLIITKIKLPPFVATFGTWLLFKGLTVLWIDGRVISGFSKGFHLYGDRKVVRGTSDHSHCHPGIYILSDSPKQNDLRAKNLFHRSKS